MHISAPYRNAWLTDGTSRIEAANICVQGICKANISAISFNPSTELSFNLPTNGEMYLAPAKLANIACAGLNTKVTLVLIF